VEVTLWYEKRETKEVRARVWLLRKKSVTWRMCMEPMSPSPSSNSTSRDSQKSVDPSFTWNAMFFPLYLHAVLFYYAKENEKSKT